MRPNYAAAVAEVIKQLGGKPFLTDCNTLYVGGRKNALDHTDSAYKNGFSPMTTGCHVIIADGLKGTDEAYVPVKGAEFVKEAKIGRAVMDADIFISLNHFKGHEATGFGGALKNIGIQARARARWKCTARESRTSTKQVHRLRQLHKNLRGCGPKITNKSAYQPRYLRGLRAVHRRLPRGRGYPRF